jgi:23S rRNA pseudouridine2604 synthase
MPAMADESRLQEDETPRDATMCAAPRMKPSSTSAENPDHPRLSKRMGELGLCSRREADRWIENGWVKVDGRVVDTLGTRVSPNARIEIDRAAKDHQSGQVTILLHKPIGYVSGQAEDGYEPAIVLIRPENRWEADPSPIQFQREHLRSLVPAGRLDIDSTGLLVLTQDGRIAKQLIGENTSVEKEYLVRVEGNLSADGMKRLQYGLTLDGVKLKPAQVSWQNEHQLRFVLRQGRKRQIRRMCELVGLFVTGLKRVRSGNVPLGGLPVGKWRYLRPEEKF